MTNWSDAVIVGAQTPRFRTVPPGRVISWKPEAVDLCASVGLYLDPGQADVLGDGLAEGADGKWLTSEIADNEPRQNGKGSILEARALTGLFLLKEPLIIWTAHEFKTAYEGFLRLRSYLDNFDHMRKRVKAIRSSTHAVEIEMLGGQRCSFLARSGGSGRGFAGLSPLFLDEAFALTREQMAALIFAMAAAPNPQVWYMSSAPLPESAVFREICSRGRRGDAGLSYSEWSAAGDFEEIKDVVTRNRLLSAADEETMAGQALRQQLWGLVAQANRAFRVRISPESILRELRAAGPEQFMRERLGVCPEIETGATIDMAAWNALADPESQRVGPLTLAVDIAPDRQWSAIALYAERPDGHGHTRLVYYAPGTDGLVAKLSELRTAVKPFAIAMGRGTYGSLREQLTAAGFAVPDGEPGFGDLAVLSSTDMTAACGQFVDAVRQARIRHVPTEQLNAAVSTAKTRRVGDTIAWYRQDGSQDITGVVTVTEARWAYYARIGVTRRPAYDPVGDIL